MFIFRRCCTRKAKVIDYENCMLEAIKGQDLETIKYLYDEMEKNKIDLNLNRYFLESVKVNSQSIIKFFAEKGADLKIGLRETKSPIIFKMLFDMKK